MIQISTIDFDKDVVAMENLIRYCITGNPNYIIHQWYFLFEVNW